MNKELKAFDIDLDSIETSNNLFDNISEAIHQMSLHTMKDRFEVILNNNLIESKEKLTNYRTIFGCRISYQDLDKNISFIVREDTKPTYEQLEQELERYKNIIDELKKEKSKNYDYVREVRTFNNNISKKDLEKFPALKQYQGKDISYIVYESIDIL